MTTICHELLPDSYLLRLIPGPTPDPELVLAHSLRCACRSGKPAVWVDCELVQDLPTAAMSMLCDYHQRLQQHHMQLVLAHASEQMKQHLLTQNPGPALRFAPTITEAALQSGLRMMARRASRFQVA